MIDPEQERAWLAALRSREPAAREAALRELFERFGRSLLELCLRIACDRTDAEDALQETFVDVLRGIDGFRGEARLSTWIFRVAIRAATRTRNRRARRQHAPLGGSELCDAREPAELALERENAQRILAAIGRLPAPQRTVLGLAALEELPQTEVAAILGIPLGTVYSRLSAARERLRSELLR